MNGLVVGEGRPVAREAVTVGKGAAKEPAKVAARAVAARAVRVAMVRAARA